MRGVDVAGPPDWKPIVFVHGVTFTRKQWVPQRDALTDEFRYVAMDLPGHGERDEGEFTLAEAVERLDEVVERVAGGEAAVVGLSLGGTSRRSTPDGTPVRSSPSSSPGAAPTRSEPSPCSPVSSRR